MGELIKIEPQLLKLGYQIIAVSADSPQYLQQSEKKHQPNYLLLSDSDMQGAKALGIAWRLKDELVEKYREYGINLEETSGRTHHLLPVPAAYVIDTQGVIRFAYINPDHRIRVNPEVLLAAAQAEAD